MADSPARVFSGSLSKTRPVRIWALLTVHPPMDSAQLARYIEETDGISKPWLLIQLRLKKLQERRHTISSEEYLREVEELHAALMELGEWWVGIEHEVFRTD
jgi:hypothetical protein